MNQKALFRVPGLGEIAIMLRRCLTAGVGIAFGVIATWAGYAFLTGIHRPGNALQLLLSSFGILLAIATWTLLDIADKSSS